MRRMLLSLMLIALLVSIVIVGCAKPVPTTAPTPAVAPTKTLDIGIATVLTGTTAFLGTHLQNAILLAIDDQNSQGGVTIAGQNYTLNPIIRDTKFDVVVGKSVAEELVYDKNVKILAGPMVGDAIGAQVVTEKNKIIDMSAFPTVPGITGPNKPYTFFAGGGGPMCMVNGSAYIQKFYPEAKTVFSLVADTPDGQDFINGISLVFPRYGLQSLGYEKIPITTVDFMPIVSRVLAKNPDIVDTSSTGSTMGAKSPVLVKQLREAGFKGLILCPTLPPPDVMIEVVPKQYLNRIITNDITVDSPVVSQAYKDMAQRYEKKFGMAPIDVSGQMYNVIKPLFEFLNGQQVMDTTTWMGGFAKYKWQGIWGRESQWVGKPIYGIDRVALWHFWAAEWTDGKPETKWAVPIPLDLFVEQP